MARRCIAISHVAVRVREKPTVTLTSSWAGDLIQEEWLKRLTFAAHASRSRDRPFEQSKAVASLGEVGRRFRVEAV
jgi:hypothetical protein